MTRTTEQRTITIAAWEKPIGQYDQTHSFKSIFVNISDNPAGPVVTAIQQPGVVRK
jgi:hypothetical protein